MSVISRRTNSPPFLTLRRFCGNYTFRTFNWIQIPRSIHYLYFLIFFAATTSSGTAQQFSWLNGCQQSGAAEAASVACDAEGRIYACGAFEDSLSLAANKIYSASGKRGFVCCANASGTAIWLEALPFPGRANSVAVARDGKLWVGGAAFIEGAGKSAGGASLSRPFILAYDPSGRLDGEANFSEFPYGSVEALALDDRGQLYAAGSRQQSANSTAGHGQDDAFIAQFSSDGALAWTRVFGGADNDAAFALAVSSDAAAVAGWCGGAINLEDRSLTGPDARAFLMEWSGSGDLVWARGLDSENGVAAGRALAPAPSGGYYLGGWYSSSLKIDDYYLTCQGMSDGFLARFDEEGELLWAVSVGGSGYEAVFDLETAASGGVYLAGWFSESARFDMQRERCKGEQDAYLARYDDQGRLAGLFAFGAGNIDKANSLALSPDNKYLYCAGGQNESADGPEASEAFYAGVPVKRLEPHGPGDQSLNFEVYFYPQPERRVLKLELRAETGAGFNVKVLDMSGKKFYDRQLTVTAPVQVTHLNLMHLQNGPYVLQVEGKSGRRRVKFYW